MPPFFACDLLGQGLSLIHISIGAMATAVCGAFTGMGRIKPEYIRTLRQQNDADFDHYIRILEKGRERFA